MQRSGVVRCTATLTGVGTSVSQEEFTPSPPKRGKILFVDVSFTGPATKIDTLNIREGVLGSIRVKYADETEGFLEAPGGIPYESANLKAQVSTDDGTSATTVTVTLDIEVL